MGMSEMIGVANIRPFLRENSQHLENPVSEFSLTTHELKVLSFMFYGYTQEEMAVNLNVPRSKLKVCYDSIFSKLHVTCRVEAVELTKSLIANL